MDEARSAVCAAIRLQAGRFESTPVHLPPSVTIQFPSTPTSASSATSYLLVSTTPSSSSSGIRTGTVEDVTAEIRAETRATTTTTAAGGAVAVTGLVKETTKSGTGRLRLTYWALDTALSAVFKGPNPRLGRPSARTKVTIILILTIKLR